MQVHEKIRVMRQSKGWSQEDMADKLDMSVNGYANIERGETDVQLSRLEKIAEVFGMELFELFNFGEKNVFIHELIYFQKRIKIIRTETKRLRIKGRRSGACRVSRWLRWRTPIPPSGMKLRICSISSTESTT